MEGPWRVHGGSTEGPWRVHGGSMEGSWRVHGGFLESAMIFTFFPLGAQNYEIILKTRVSRFLAFYPLKSVFEALPCIPNDRSRKDLSIGIKDAQFHAMGLDIEPF